jgi:molybdopterin synthase catalytic subunit
MSFLSPAPIDLATLISRIESPAHGGVASFLGQVRDHHGRRTVRRLEYSSYGPMAEEECARIVAEAEARWPVRVALAHRVGALEIGDTAVAVAAAGAHRDEAFAACRFVIEEVKRRVPIWKKEFYQDGAVEWVGATRESAGEVSRS